MKKSFKIGGLILVSFFLLGLGTYLITLFSHKSQTYSPLSKIPNDAIFIIETDRIDKGWSELAKSPVWKLAVENEYYQDFSVQAQFLDSLMKEQETFQKLLKGKPIFISAHMVSPNDYDFLLVIDIQKDFRLIQPAIDLLSSSMGYTISTHHLQDSLSYHKFISPEDNQTIYFGTADNLVYFSENKNLLLKAHLTQASSSVQSVPVMSSTESILSKNKSFTYYFNYAQLTNYLQCFFSEKAPFSKLIQESFSISAFDIDFGENTLDFSGYTSYRDHNTSYIKALAGVSPAASLSAQVIPEDAAVCLSWNFNNFASFYQEMSQHFLQEDSMQYKKWNKEIESVSRLFDIDLEKDLLSWVGKEIAIVKTSPTSESNKEDMLAFVHTNSIKEAKEGLSNIMSQLKKRSPVKFNSYDYQNHPVHYMEMKQVFRLVFGKLFDQLDKPYFTFIEDYVVFSNSKHQLMYAISQYQKANTLDNNSRYKDFKKQFHKKSNIHTFIQIPNLYSWLYHFSDAKTQTDLAKHKELLLNFEHVGFQLTAFQEGFFKTELKASHSEEAPYYAALEQLERKAEDLACVYFESHEFLEFMDLTQLPEQDTVWTFHYPSGQIQARGEIKKQLPVGTWRSFYPDGNIESVVSYDSKGRLDGTALFFHNNKKETPWAEMDFDKDEIEGTYKEYYTTGTQKAILEYDDNKADGKARFFYENGQLKIEGRYQDGHKKGKWKYYLPNGESLDFERWKKGEKK